jgi:hypothetical protein
VRLRVRGRVDVGEIPANGPPERQEICGIFFVYLDKSESCPDGQTIEVLLDGQPIKVPSERRSLSGIFSFLDAVALEQQRVLYWLTVDGRPAEPGQSFSSEKTYVRIEAASLDLHQLPLQLIQTAMHQTVEAIGEVQSAVSTVLINDTETARELWWKLARKLKSPLLTLSLLPESSCGPANGRASLGQLRKWQLQQLGSLLKDVDGTCCGEDTRALSNVLEQRVLPWLETLGDSLELWLETLLMGNRIVEKC